MVSEILEAESLLSYILTHLHRKQATVSEERLNLIKSTPDRLS